jgi:hypothetical protein
MIPSSTEKASVLLMLSDDRNVGLIVQNAASMMTSRTNGPNSGRPMIRARRVRIGCARGSLGRRWVAEISPTVAPAAWMAGNDAGPQARGPALAMPVG